MSDSYKEFENRFSTNWFSASWVEVEQKPKERKVLKKDLATLEVELEKINQEIDTISQKQLRLSNLAKFYEQNV